jgi:hypothetical protein
MICLIANEVSSLANGFSEKLFILLLNIILRTLSKISLTLCGNFHALGYIALCLMGNCLILFEGLDIIKVF